MAELFEKTWPTHPANGYTLERLIINWRLRQVKEIWARDPEPQQEPEPQNAKKVKAGKDKIKKKINKKKVKAAKNKIKNKINKKKISKEKVKAGKNKIKNKTKKPKKKAMKAQR